MRNTPEPSWHKQREQEIIAHVERMLTDPKFIIDTSSGRRSVVGLKQSKKHGDKTVELKRIMSQLRPDRALELQMPTGQTFEATFAVNKWIIFQKVIGRLMVVVQSPTKEILKDEPPQPLSAGETRRALAALPPPLPGVPTTTVLVSTSGFHADAHELAERTSERTIVLVEPNESGGWSVYGSTEMSGVLRLFDPEPEDTKQKRVEQAIDLMKDELITGSLSADKIAHETQLPLQLVEDAVKSYAKNTSGLMSKRFDGRLLLFREGSMPTGKSVGGEGMSLLDRIKTLFSRKGDNERKIAFLSERRAALTSQRETSHEEVFKLEKKESELRHEFKANESPMVRKRITSQLVQLRKEIERRTQLLQVLNQQINVVSTHLHNLELLQQGKGAQLPDSEEIASDAAAAEEMLAQLQADSEVADSVSASTTMAGLSSEEQALYEELLAESGDGKAKSAAAESTDVDEVVRQTPTKAPAASNAPRRAESEPG
jgi:hypothetical protein